MPLCCVTFEEACKHGSIQKITINPKEEFQQEFAPVYHEYALESALELYLILYDDNGSIERKLMRYCPFCGNTVHGQILSTPG